MAMSLAASRKRCMLHCNIRLHGTGHFPVSYYLNHLPNIALTHRKHVRLTSAVMNMMGYEEVQS